MWGFLTYDLALAHPSRPLETPQSRNHAKGSLLRDRRRMDARRNVGGTGYESSEMNIYQLFWRFRACRFSCPFSFQFQIPKQHNPIGTIIIAIISSLFGCIKVVMPIQTCLLCMAFFFTEPCQHPRKLTVQAFRFYLCTSPIVVEQTR
jgi:hypothetical protein